MMKLKLSLALLLSGYAASSGLPARRIERPPSGAAAVDTTGAGTGSAVQEAKEEADPAEIASWIKGATAKFKPPHLTSLLERLQEALRKEIPAYGASTGWIASTRMLAGRLLSPGETVPNEFGAVRMLSAKDGKPPSKAPPELFQPRTVAYRFGYRDYWPLKDSSLSQNPIELRHVDPADQLTWILAGHTPEIELALAGIERELDVDRSRDKLSRFLEYWRNGKESFYQALDRTAGTKDVVFFYDAMLGEFASKLAPGLLKFKSLPEKHDRLHDSFLTLRFYRSFIEATALTLVSTRPLPERLKAYEYVSPGDLVKFREAVELLLASHGGDFEKVIEDLRSVLKAHPLPRELWGHHDPTTHLIEWCRDNSTAIRGRASVHDPERLSRRDLELVANSRKNRHDTEQRIRTAARAFLREQGVSPEK